MTELRSRLSLTQKFIFAAQFLSMVALFALAVIVVVGAFFGPSILAIDYGHAWAWWIYLGYVVAWPLVWHGVEKVRERGRG